MDSITALQHRIRQFRDERDWLQFHHPKDMAMAIAIEAAELQELFLWKSPDEINALCEGRREDLADEIADIAAYLFELADLLNIPLGEALLQKIEKNARKYPVEQARGSNLKYNQLPRPPAV